MTLEVLELDVATHRDIALLCEIGDELAKCGNYEVAINEYNKAWKLIPEPKSKWQASTWVLAALADCCYLLGKSKSARQALEYAMTCPGGIGNPFLHLRLGQVLFDFGDLDAAADELMRAYMGAGKDIFANDHAKYFAFLKTRAKI